jgi:hypothetical protein
MEDAEREYIEAKAAYDAALARLVAARKARPKHPTKAELRTMAYLDGNRNYKALAEEFCRSRTWVGNVISDRKYFGRFGPETAHEHEMRMWLTNETMRLQAARDAMVEEGLRMAMEPGRSSAWHMAHKAFEEGRLRAAAEEC